ncbi:MAG TPA: Ig-like domain-containing protein, partial [Telluria sp.]|nr:Ig-like domain-containing protein [Telluria sp.]
MNILPSPIGKQVAFIDTGVAGYQQLVAAVPEGVEVVLLDSSSSALAQIAAWAANHAGYDAIHVLSHGQEGMLALAGGSIDAARLDDPAVAALARQLGAALGPDGDLLLYGCSVASGEVGRAFIEKLAALTGADVAASTGLTGAAARGGDWTLEAATGTVEASAIRASAFGQVLLNDANFDGTPDSSATAAASATFDGWTFGTVGGQAVVFDKSEYSPTYLNGGAPGESVVVNAWGVTNVYAYYMAPADNSAFRPVSFGIGNGAGMDPSEEVKITGYLNGNPVTAGEWVNLGVSDTDGDITYTKLGDVTSADTPPGYVAWGTVSFGPAFPVVDKLVFEFKANSYSLGVLEIDNIDVDPAVAGPTVTSVTTSASNRTYKVGDMIEVAVNFSAAVNVTGTPKLQLETGATDRSVSYYSGSGSSTLLFRYTVQAGDTAADLDYTGTGALTLSGGTIKSSGGADATLTLAAPGAANSLGNSKDLVIDGLAPTLSISSDKSTFKSGETATITFTFSEDPGASFVHGDIAVTGGALGALAGSGLTRTAVFTPTAGTNAGTASISVASGNYTDPAGNGGGAGSSPSLTFDTAAPAAPLGLDLVTADDTGFSNTDNWTNKPVMRISGTAEAGATVTLYGNDGTTPIGTGTAAGDGSWTITTSALPTNVHSIKARATDAAGNVSAASVALTVELDTTPSLLTITSDKSVIKAGETATFTFNFGEDPGATITDSDLAVTGGTLGALSGTGPTRTAVFTPDANASGTAVVVISANAYTDPAGNGNTFQLINVATVDTQRPSLAIASDKPVLKVGETANITFTFSEDPGASFIDGDIVVTGGTLGALSGTGTTRTAVFTPTAGVNSTSASITVADALYSDAAGNSGTAATTPSLTIDTLAPAAPLALDLLAADDSGFSDTDNWTNKPVMRISGTAEAGATVTLYGNDGITPIGTGTAAGDGSWTIATSALPTNVHAIKAKATDAAGNVSPASAALTVELDTTPSLLSITSDKSVIKAGETATFTFNFGEDPGATITDSDLAVTGGTLGALS